MGCCSFCIGWRREAVHAGRSIKRIVVAYEAGRDGFWLARWLRAREIEAPSPQNLVSSAQCPPSAQYSS
jgi:hypothetical protein